MVANQANPYRAMNMATASPTWLHVRTQEALACVGLTGRISAEARPLTEVVVHAYGKHVGSWNLDDIDSSHPHPLILGQDRTQHLLADLLAERGVSVGWNLAAQSRSARRPWPGTW